MEGVEEPLLENVTAETVKDNVVSITSTEAEPPAVKSDVCHKSNGITDLKDSERVQSPVDEPGIPEETHTSNIVMEEENNIENVVTEEETTTTEVDLKESNTTTIAAAAEEVTKDITSTESEKQEVLDIKSDNNEVHEWNVEIDGIVETTSENVRFETEILIETNDDQPAQYKVIYSDTDEPNHSNNILNELGENIELSEVLRSSDVTEHVENNNCEVRQEVFNKEELLDILEGNDVEESRKVISDNFSSDCKKLESQLALQQLSRLKQTRKPRNTPRKTDKKTSKSHKEESIKKKSTTQKGDNSSPKDESIKKKSNIQKGENESPKEGVKITKSSSQKGDHELPKDEGIKKKSSTQKEDNESPKEEIAKITKSSPQKGDNEPPKEECVKIKSTTQKVDNLQINTDATAEPKEASIINALVKDWEDDEPTEGDQPKILEKESEILLGESDEVVKSQEATLDESKISNADVPVVDDQTPCQNKISSEPQPQRRLGRVIKKKVIFDPDNPDTFTKTKVAIKKENQSEKDLPTPKKIKTDPTSPRPKSKSPIQAKLQWKKPQAKNLKQNKRLTEIDRLLMDEGAVNMICQLTPEAPKGHKNMKSKAEFIKKIQSSTPEGKEMKFRERKKESKSEEGDAKRIGSGKERLSLSSSVKSPAVSEDFEAHSADDSIIYRRHSSSSYSSPCMSPRRLSDVEIINQTVLATAQVAALEGQTHGSADPSGITQSDVFMSENAGSLVAGVINKSDFLSIKEKLNSKLSQALNKRKRESMKAEKPSKIKKVAKLTEKPAVVGEYKYVRLNIDQKLAEICILQAGSIYDVEVITELTAVLETVEGKNDISVILLSAESDVLCSGLDLKLLLDQEKCASHAQQIAESVRLLLSTLEGHSKLVCTAVEDRCHSLGLSLVALSDITVASEKATFELTAYRDAPLQPGAAVLTSCGLPQSLLNEIIVFGRPISAAEALQSGLVSRIVWPERVVDQARAIAKDIAAQPAENIMLKKQLLRLKRGGPEPFLASLEKELDLIVKYWTSAEGRNLVRASLETHKE